MSVRTYHISFHELLMFYHRHRLRLLLCFFIPFVMIIVASFIPVPRYEASSVLIVRLSPERSDPSEFINKHNGPETLLPFDRNQIFKSEVAILNSDDLHVQVINTIGLQHLYPELLNPSALRAFWNDMLQAFGFAHLVTEDETQRLIMAKALKRFDKRLNIKLDNKSAIITLAFQNADAVVAVATLGKLLDLYMEKRKQLYMEPHVERAQNQIQAAHQKSMMAEEALEKYKRDHKIYSLTDQRGTLLQDRSEVGKKQATIKNPAFQKKLSFFNRQLGKLDLQEREYDRLQSEKRIADDEYALAAHKLNEAVAFEDLERERGGSVHVIQPPMAPAEPHSWQFLIILLGFFLSVLFALGTASLTEFLRGGFLTPERLERKAAVPVLADLPIRD